MLLHSLEQRRTETPKQDRRYETARRVETANPISLMAIAVTSRIVESADNPPLPCSNVRRPTYQDFAAALAMPDP